jgi:hypothetical protein
MARIKMPDFHDAPLSRDAEWLSHATLDRMVYKLRRLRVNVTAEELPHSPNRTSDVLCYSGTYRRPSSTAQPVRAIK